MESGVDGDEDPWSPSGAGSSGWFTGTPELDGPPCSCCGLPSIVTIDDTIMFGAFSTSTQASTSGRKRPTSHPTTLCNKKDSPFPGFNFEKKKMEIQTDHETQIRTKNYYSC